MLSFQFASAENSKSSEIEIDSLHTGDLNIGKTSWSEAHYPPNGMGIVQVVDPDMNLDPKTVDSFDVDVWSDSDASGIDLTLTETGKSTGIFEGTVFFAMFHSTSTTVRVAEGDTVIAEYEDYTLPDPYTTADKLDITATTYIGYSPYNPCNDYAHYNDRQCRQPSLRTVDAFGNSLEIISVDQPMSIIADLTNGQNREQTFAYLVQIQNNENVVVYLKWITGTLSSGQSFSPALSWIPTEVGTYAVTAFVWDSVDSASPLSRPSSTSIDVKQ